LSPFAQVVLESTCQKRVTVCELFSADGALLARESNRCKPPGGVCQRLGVSNGQVDYPDASPCNWTHAEMVALEACRGVPTKAVIYGHDFACPSCELALRTAGVEQIEIIPVREGTGPR